MKNNVQVKQVTIQNKEPKMVILGKVSNLTLGKQGGSLEGNSRPHRSW